MHNMVVKANKEKLEEELKRIKTILKKRQERRVFDKADDGLESMPLLHVNEREERQLEGSAIDEEQEEEWSNNTGDEYPYEEDDELDYYDL